MGRDDEQPEGGDEVDAEVDAERDAERDDDGEIDPDLVPTVIVRASGDPMERAKTALRAARLARGADPDEPEPAPPPRVERDPLARAATALEQAAAARAEATKGGKAGVERENRAREELRRLKGGAGRDADGASSDDAAPDDAAPGMEPAAPKKRRL